jgi:hypothetical protein
MSLAQPASRPLKVDRRNIDLYQGNVDTGVNISGLDFYGDLTKGGAHGLAEYNMLDLLKFYNWIRWLYVRNQTVTLSYVGSGGNLGIMRDNRMQAGDATNHANSFRTAGQTPDISSVDVDWSKIQANYDTSVPKPNILDYACDSPPLMVGGYGAIRGSSMRKFPMEQLGELVAEALGEIGNNKSKSYIADMTTGRMGGYAIIRQDATLPASHDDGGTLTDMGRVFEDTIANAGAYTSGGIPETKDQPLAVNAANQWNLYSMDVPTNAPPPPPNMVFVDADGGIHEWGLAGMQQYFEQSVQHIAANGYNTAGSGKLIFYIAGEINGVNLGNGGSSTALDAGFGEVENERLNGASASGYTQGPAQPAAGDNYRTQEFPNGVAQIYNTYSLRSYTNPVV